MMGKFSVSAKDACMIDMSRNRFILILSLLCLTYLAFECWLDQYAMITVDEYWFATLISEYRAGIPPHLSPYQTVVGHYLLLIPMYFGKSTLDTLIIVKDTVAVINTIFIIIASLMISRTFGKWPTLLSVILLISMEIMLNYSTNIRVDLMAYWIALFSILLLMNNRYVIAGLLLGISFTISHKCVWYWLASDAALFITWMHLVRTQKYMLGIILYNITALCAVAIYLAIWATASDLQSVLTGVTNEASTMYQLDWNNSARYFFWQVILLYNPLPFLLWPLTLVSLLFTFHQDPLYRQRFFVVIFSFIILLCLINYKQVFPYYMQITLPMYLLLYAAFFAWIIQLLHHSHSFVHLGSKNNSVLFLVLYILLVTLLIINMKLPIFYLLINFIPLLMIGIIYYPALASHVRTLFLVMFIVLGLIMPGMLFAVRLVNAGGEYQRTNIDVMTA